MEIQKNLVHPTSVISNSLSIKTKICCTVVVHSLLLDIVRKDFLPYKTLNWMFKRWLDGPDSSVLPNPLTKNEFTFEEMNFSTSIGFCFCPTWYWNDLRWFPEHCFVVFFQQICALLWWHNYSNVLKTIDFVWMYIPAAGPADRFFMYVPLLHQWWFIHDHYLVGPIKALF